MDFREELTRRRVLLADGAMGTMLFERGVSVDHCLEELNLSSPDLVRQIHHEYVAAGAEILLTNTFGANRRHLGWHHLAGQLEPIVRAGVRLAREAAGDAALVGGSVGPMRGDSAFHPQIKALVGAGVDLLVLETFYELEQLRRALAAAREVGGADLPVLAQVTVNDRGLLRDGSSADVFAPRLADWGADVVGCNCSTGPESVLRVVEQMARLTNKPISAKPSAGAQETLPPAAMAAFASRLVAAGASIVGGCCGTTPEHIRQTWYALAEHRLAHRADRD